MIFQDKSQTLLVIILYHCCTFWECHYVLNIQKQRKKGKEEEGKKISRSTVDLNLTLKKTRNLLL